MALRKVIKIDEEKCTGCGLCIPECPEGAIQIIDGKARLVSEIFCDGLGACIGYCPEGAITIEEREAERYDEKRVMENIVRQGENVIKAHLKHLRDHNQRQYLKEAIEYLKERNVEVPVEFKEEKENAFFVGCAALSKFSDLLGKEAPSYEDRGERQHSELCHWPIQLKLLNPYAPFLRNAHLLISADCVPFTYANFHNRFLKGRVLIFFCPKLDSEISEYVEKLSLIFKNCNIQSVTLLHMEVPCCFGLKRIIEAALVKSGKDIRIKDYTISIKGEVMG